MKRRALDLAPAIVLATFAVSASAATIELDPLLDDAQTITHDVCGGSASACGADGATMSGTDMFTLQIDNPGFLNSIGSVLLAPSTAGSFLSWHYVIQEPLGPITLATADQPGVSSKPPNLPVAIATYSIIVDWTLQSFGLTSASYTIDVGATSEPLALAVPEPGALALLAAGLAVAGLSRRKRC